MSKIEELILKHCPQGVEYKELGEVVDYNQPTKYIVESTDYDNNYTIPVLTAGDSFILGYTNEIEGIYKANKEYPVIIFDDFTTSFHWVDFNFKVKSSAMKILTPKEGINFRYIYFFMKTIGYKPSEHARQWISKYSYFKVPVPPLRVQLEIVRILDVFKELEEELEEELESREKQYRYYRDKLLSYDAQEVEYIPMGEVGIFIRGNGLQKKDFTESGVGCIHYGQIYTYYGTYADKTKSFVSPELANSLKQVKHGDIIIAVTSENIQDICKCVVWLGEEDIVTGGHAMIFKHNENPKYIAYYLQTSDFFRQKIRYARGTKVIDISKTDMEKIPIPVPSLSEQERVVKILDKFDNLLNDISIGLPAEIKARRQQYEYYRNKLLSFKDVNSQV